MLFRSILTKKARLFCEQWTFDEDDKHKYGMKWNNQFFFFQKESVYSEKCLYDLYFIGADKGRLQILKKIQNALKSLSPGVITQFEILGNYRDILSVDMVPLHEHKAYVNVLKDIYMSRCILDIKQNGQKGLTLRCLEAMFLGKKLITNNPSIMFASFYSPDNILLIDENADNLDAKRIIDFMFTPFTPVDYEALDDYSVDGWLSHFANSDYIPRNRFPM